MKGVEGPGYLSGIALRREIPSGSYLRGLGPVRYLMEGRILDFDRPVSFLVGENGSGKSTLLEAAAVACGFNAEGGTKNFRFSTSGERPELEGFLAPIRHDFPWDGFFLRAESFYNAATYIDQLDREPSLGGRVVDSYGGRSLHKQSHGESFLALVQNRFQGHGLYFLDEPEAALSPSRLLTLMGEIHYLVQEHSQFIIATHSPILMAYPDARLYLLSQDGISAVGYRETEHYQLTKRFLNDPDKMMEFLFRE